MADPGSCHVCFDRHCMIHHVEVYLVDSAGKRTCVSRSPEPEPNGITGIRFLECRVTLPPITAGQALVIVVTMRGEAQWEGTIGLRRTWGVADAPWTEDEIRATLIDGIVTQ